MSLLRNLCVALLGVTVLSACDATGQGATSFFAASNSPENVALPSASLAGGDIVVSGPEGYCVDATTLNRTNSGGFAALASCNILTSGESGPFVEPGLVTITVRRAGAAIPTMASLAAALNTELLSERELSEVSAGRMATGGETAFEGSDPRHWRGVFVHGTHLVGLALYAPNGSPLVGAQGAAFLNTVSSRIRANSVQVEARAEQ